jgi:hypothetical protein
LTAFESESWRFLNVAEPDPSALTVTDPTLESTWSYWSPFGPVSSTEFWKVVGSEYVPGPVYGSTFQLRLESRVTGCGMLQVLLEKPVLASEEQAGSADSGCVNVTVNLTAPVTVRVAVNWWVPPDTAPVVGFAG